MAESVLSVCWKDRTSELSPVYKSLLENNFLVDCTISAEGQNIKAHRLVLSASSPYFHELFSEETRKHAFVIILNASFEILKAVIDFVYRGETQIPEGNLKPFLTLAQSLQIKGLQAFTQEYENNLSSSTENIPQDSCEENQVTCEVQGVNASQVDSPEKNHHSVGYTGAVSKNSSVPLKGYRVLCDQVRSSSVMIPLQEQWRQGGDDVSTPMEITVKDELAVLEARNEKLDNAKSDNPKSGNFKSNMDGRTSSVCSEEDLNVFASCNETSHGNTEPSELPSSQQQLTQLEDQISSGQDVADESESLLPVVLVPKSEQLTIEEDDEPMDYPDKSGSDMDEMTEEAGPASAEQNLDQSSKENAAEITQPLFSNDDLVSFGINEMGQRKIIVLKVQEQAEEEFVFVPLEETIQENPLATSPSNSVSDTSPPETDMPSTSKITCTTCNKCNTRIYTKEVDVKEWVQKNVRYPQLFNALTSGQFSEKDRRHLVQIVVAEMCKEWGNEYPPSSFKESVAIALVKEFPILKSKVPGKSHESYFDKKTGEGYLEYRLKTIRLRLPESQKKRKKSSSSDLANKKSSKNQM